MASRPIPRDGVFHVVLNGAASGRPDAALCELIERTLVRAGRRVRLHPARARAVAAVADHAAARARLDRGVVVAVGGDGTVSTVAQAARTHGVPIGVVPRGTFNFFARQHGVPLEPADAVQALLAPQARSVQVGCLNGRCFVVNASLGLYPDLLHERERDTKRFGRWRAVALVSGIVHALRRRRRLQLQLEQAGEVRVVEASTLFVGNNPLQIEPLGLNDTDALARGRLVALTLPPLPPASLARLMLRAALGRLGDAEEVNGFPLATMTVRPLGSRRMRLRVACDGEVHWQDGPLRFKVEPRGLALVGGHAG